MSIDTIASRAGRMVVAVAVAAIWTGTIEAGRAAEVAAPSAAGLERITEFFDNEIATGKLPGAVVLIQQHGKPVYLKCFGVRDVASKLPMTPDTIFAIHSMTKPITSLAAMMLIDAGKLSLTDPASKFIPGFAHVKVGVSPDEPDARQVLKLVPLDRPITVTDLLRHTSGITYDYIGGKLIMKAYSEFGLFDGYFDNRYLPTASPDCRWRGSPGRSGVTGIRPMSSAASSRSSPGRRCINSKSSTSSIRSA